MIVPDMPLWSARMGAQVVCVQLYGYGEPATMFAVGVKLTIQGRLAEMRLHCVMPRRASPPTPCILPSDAGVLHVMV